MKSIVVNVAIGLPKAIANRAILVSKRFEKQGVMFVLNKKDHYPHITLYITKFPFRNVPLLLKELEKVTRRARPFKMIATKYQQNMNGYVEVEFKKTKQLADLQRNIIRSLNHLREGLLYDAGGLRHTPAQRKSYRRFGYDHAGREFHPHVSITRFATALPNFKAKEFPDRKKFSFEGRSIYLFLVGEHFTSLKIIKKFTVR